MIFLFFGTSLALLEAELQHFKEIGDGLVARERQRLPKNLILGQKHNFFKNPKKNARTKTEVFLDSNGQNLFRTVDETSKNQTVWPQ